MSDFFDKLFDQQTKEEMKRSLKDLSEKFSQVLNKTSDSTNANTSGADTTQKNTPVNIIETGDAFRIEILAPGFAKEQFKITLDNNALCIKGEKEPVELPKGEKKLRTEFNTNNFERTFNLPDTADPNKISAAASNGILTLSIGKKDEAIAKSGIEINIG